MATGSFVMTVNHVVKSHVTRKSHGYHYLHGDWTSRDNWMSHGDGKLLGDRICKSRGEW